MNFKIYDKKEKKEFTALSKAVCNSVSVAEIATNLYGLTLYTSRNNKKYLKCYEHPSLVFDLQKNLVFYNAKVTSGMSGYDFVAFYEGISFLEARNKLNEYYVERDPRNIEMYQYDHVKDTVFKHKGVYLPAMSPTKENVQSYLLSQGIGKATIHRLFEQDFMYQDDKNNLVVVGYDLDTFDPVYAIKIGTGSVPYKMECQGSYKRMGIPVINRNQDSQLNVCFDVIEMIRLLDKNPNANVLFINEDSELEKSLHFYKDNYKWFDSIDTVQFVLGDKSEVNALNLKENLEKSCNWLKFETPMTDVSLKDENEIEEEINVPSV